MYWTTLISEDWLEPAKYRRTMQERLRKRDGTLVVA